MRIAPTGYATESLESSAVVAGVTSLGSGNQGHIARKRQAEEASSRR